MTRSRSSRRRSSYVALTGTPGTGKSSAAARLPSRIGHVEVGELALRVLGAVERKGSVTVDLPRLGRWISKNPPLGEATVVVGHLSHLLPIRDVVLLRCHPVELARRLRRGRSMTLAERRANVWAEATDVILFEARRQGRRIWEIDATTPSPERVACRIASLVDRTPAPTRRFVDWLADPTVTEHL